MSVEALTPRGREAVAWGTALEGWVQSAPPQQSPRERNARMTISRIMESNEDHALKAIANLTGLYTIYSIREDFRECVGLLDLQEVIRLDEPTTQTIGLRLKRKFTDMLNKSCYLGSAILAGIGYAVASPLLVEVGAFGALISGGLLFLRAIQEFPSGKTSLLADYFKVMGPRPSPQNPRLGALRRLRLD